MHFQTCTSQRTFDTRKLPLGQLPERPPAAWSRGVYILDLLYYLPSHFVLPHLSLLLLHSSSNNYGTTRTIGHREPSYHGAVPSNKAEIMAPAFTHWAAIAATPTPTIVQRMLSTVTSTITRGGSRPSPLDLLLASIPPTTMPTPTPTPTATPSGMEIAVLGPTVTSQPPLPSSSTTTTTPLTTFTGLMTLHLGLLPLWAWLTIYLSLLLIGTLEYARSEASRIWLHVVGTKSCAETGLHAPPADYDKYYGKEYRMRRRNTLVSVFLRSILFVHFWWLISLYRILFLHRAHEVFQANAEAEAAETPAIPSPAPALSDPPPAYEA